MNYQRIDKRFLRGLAEHLIAGVIGGAVVYFWLRAGFAGIW